MDKNCICRNFHTDSKALYWTSPEIDNLVTAVAKASALVEHVCLSDVEAKLSFFRSFCSMVYMKCEGTEPRDNVPLSSVRHLCQSDCTELRTKYFAAVDRSFVSGIADLIQGASNRSLLAAKLLPLACKAAFLQNCYESQYVSNSSTCTPATAYQTPILHGVRDCFYDRFTVANPTAPTCPLVEAAKAQQLSCDSPSTLP